MSDIRVLVVDDMPMVLDLFRLIIDERLIETASTGDEAIARLESDPTLGIVITDLALPGGGRDLVQNLRRRFPDRVVIVMSGNPALLHDPAIAAAGVFDRIQKGSTTVDAIEKKIERARAHLSAQRGTP